ncbi:lytic transglycosylase F [Metapseudomonas resinovorans]|uniref:Putative lytic transglycosylase n=1 Tax=Metapseudomonas resinovorans NBRC 106553 TaxID=1245471 RepID=S6ANL0_METRE|nr:lytic transglycosylase F [Pseudomonas resinovorans]BAN47188.1 putative lytic transglycosylase [Pseudomonas resinovorans NBRC 106553]
MKSLKTLAWLLSLTLLVGRCVWAEDLPSVELSASEEAEVESMVLPVPAAWKGDFEGMRERRLVRILVPYSKTFYAVDRGRQRGIAYEIGRALEGWLNKNHPYKNKSLQWRVAFFPVDRGELLDKLVAGEGDIAAGGLAITDKRQQSVDFSTPFASGVREVVVTGPKSDKIEKLDDLAGKEVMVRPSSSYYEHLIELNASFRERGLEPIVIKPADENLESEDLLEMVNAGLVNAIVVDRYIADSWNSMLKNLVIHVDMPVRDDVQLAWAVRKDSPQLLKALDGFVKTHKLGTTFGNSLRNKYVKNSKALYDATDEEELKRFAELVGLFEKHAGTYDFDYLMLMAQGFQESQLDQKARSHRGAVGVMQLMPSTAADPSVGIAEIDKSADRNIEAGSKYMRLLADKYLNDPGLTPMNRTLMTFAAYNAGPGNLRKFRRLAEKSGLDKNVWFGNVEHAAARVVGRETVDYVGNIYKYYVAYKLSRDKEMAKARNVNAVTP